MATSSQPKAQTRPDRALARSKRDKYLNTGQVAAELGGLLSAGQVRDMALKGEIKGAIRVRQRVYVPRWVVPSLVVELEFHAQPHSIRPRRNTFDGLAV